MTGSELVNMYEFSYGAINRNLDGITDEESLLRPEYGGNCLNWVLGHVVVHRDTMLGILGESGVLSDAQAAPYRRGSTPCENDTMLDLATLRGLLADSQQRLIPAMAMLSGENLAQPVPETHRRSPLKTSIGDALVRLHYHEAYHNGQIGLLRRFVGKEGAIR